MRQRERGLRSGRRRGGAALSRAIRGVTSPGTRGRAKTAGRLSACRHAQPASTPPHASTITRPLLRLLLPTPSLRLHADIQCLSPMAARQPPPATAEAPPLLSPAGRLGCLVPYSRALAPFPFGSFYIDSPTIRPPGVYPLPVELLAEIVRHVHKKAHLKTLCCVSRLFRDLAEAQLYSDVWLYNLSAAESLQQNLSRHPTRQALVRRFSVDFDRMGADTISTINLPKPIAPAACLNLEELQVARNGSTIDDFHFVLELTRTLRLASFHRPSSQRILPSLTIVRLDLRPISGTSISEYSLEYNVLHIFFNPTLREIALRNANFSSSSFPDMLEYDRFARQTPLRLLRLKDCKIDPIVIQKLLLIPRALETFHLDFFRHPSQLDWSLGDLDTWTQTFMLQTHALKEIAIIIGPSLPRIPLPISSTRKRLDLRAMQVLSKVAGDFFIDFSHMSDHVQVISNDEYERSLAGNRTRWDTLGDFDDADILYDWAHIRRNPVRYDRDWLELRCLLNIYDQLTH